MTREEQIIETAKFIYSPSSGIPQSLPMRVGFIEGAKWADKTMIEKVCKWLRANIDLYADTRRSFSSNYQEVYLTDNFETEFRKAMEE